MEGCAAEIKGSIYVHQFAEYLGLRFKDLADQEKVALCKTLNSAANDVNPGSQYLQLAYGIGDVFTEVYKDVVLRKKYDNQKNYVFSDETLSKFKDIKDMPIRKYIYRKALLFVAEHPHPELSVMWAKVVLYTKGINMYQKENEN